MQRPGSGWDTELLLSLSRQFRSYSCRAPGQIPQAPNHDLTHILIRQRPSQVIRQPRQDDIAQLDHIV